MAAGDALPRSLSRRSLSRAPSVRTLCARDTIRNDARSSSGRWQLQRAR
jgi:hypothetical protein